MLKYLFAALFCAGALTAWRAPLHLAHDSRGTATVSFTSVLI